MRERIQRDKDFSGEFCKEKEVNGYIREKQVGE